MDYLENKSKVRALSCFFSNYWQSARGKINCGAETLTMIMITVR